MLFQLISPQTLSSSIHAGISDELHQKCSDVWDYAGCVNNNKKFSRKMIKKYLR